MWLPKNAVIRVQLSGQDFGQSTVLNFLQELAEVSSAVPLRTYSSNPIFWRSYDRIIMVLANFTNISLRITLKSYTNYK